MPSVLSIGTGSLEIALEGKEWILRNSETGAVLVGERKVMCMLPLLQTPILELQESLRMALLQGGLPPEDLDSFPFGQIIEYALKWPTDYWVGMAIGWLEALPHAEVYQGALEAITGKKHFPQAMRHRAMKLLRKKPSPRAEIHHV